MTRIHLFNMTLTIQVNKNLRLYYVQTVIEYKKTSLNTYVCKRGCNCYPVSFSWIFGAKA